MLLDLPDVRQRADCDCGTAAADTVGLFLLARSIREALADTVDGLHPSALEAAMRRAGLLVQSGTMTTADLRHHTRLGRPVLCAISAYGGHWVVVRGVERGAVHYHCPVNGREKKLLRQWLDVWRDSTRAGHDFDSWGIAVAPKG